MNKVYFNRTHNIAFNKHVYGYSTGFSAGNEYTVCNSTEGIIGKSPGVFGKLGGVTCFVCTDCFNFNFGIGCIEYIFGGKVCMVKFSVCKSSGNYHKRVGNGTDGTVARRASENYFIGTFKFCCIGCGTAAVKFNCRNAAEFEHKLCLFGKSKTCCFGFLVTVCKHKNNVAVFFNTNSGTGIFIGSIKSCANFTIPNKKEMTCNSFNNVFGILTEGVLLTNHCGTVLHNCEELILVAHCIAVDVNAFHNECTGGLTGRNVIVCCVGGCNNVVSAFFGCGICLFNDRSFAPNAGVVVIVIVSFNKNTVVGCNVRINYKVRNAVTVFVISNNFGFGNTGSKFAYSFGSYRKAVAVSARNGAEQSSLFFVVFLESDFFIVSCANFLKFECQYSCGSSSDNHKYGKDHGKKTLNK